jgi:uncharacterized protein YgiM (DUF1202 family)
MAVEQESPVNRAFVSARAATALLASTGLLVGLFGVLPASAASQVTAREGVHIRSGPSTRTAVVGGLTRGQTVTALTHAKGWTRIRFAGSRAYIASRYLGHRAEVGAPRIPADGAKITTSALNLRRGPGLSYGVVEVIAEGTRVQPTGKSAPGFQQVSYGGSRGWLSTQYLASSAAGPEVVQGRASQRDSSSSRYARTALNVRSSSSQRAGVVAQVAKGTQLRVTGVRTNGRSQVLYAGDARWVVSKFLTKRRPSTAPTPSYPVEKGLTARAIAVHRAALKAWPQITTYYGYRNDPSSDHYLGRALDLMIPDYKTAAGKALGYKVAAWAQANQKNLGIQYVIWNQHIWNVSRASEGWRLMADRGSDSANHKNHVHISVLA